jgi:hypothetical protein
LKRFDLSKGQGILERHKVRGGYTPSVPLYAQTWDVWSICTSVGAWKSVPDLEGFKLGQGQGMLGRDKVRGGCTPSPTLCGMS